MWTRSSPIVSREQIRCDHSSRGEGATRPTPHFHARLRENLSNRLAVLHIESLTCGHLEATRVEPEQLH